jgi:cyclase
MLKKRIIPCLDIKNGRVVKGVNFIGLQDAGNPVELARIYSESGADELVFLDIAATLENRKTLVNLVVEIARDINIPFTVGGGILTPEDAYRIIDSGADKVSLNTAAFQNKNLISGIAKQFGTQAVVVAIDAKKIGDKWVVFTHGGFKNTKVTVTDWAVQAEQYGAGEILLTAMNQDGTKNGFALELTDSVTKSVNIPVIASGGAGTMAHFKALFTDTAAAAALAASVFHYGNIGIADLKNYLKKSNIPVR